ncbi:hypothetical protein [Actinocrispum sp. NPDC049592]|uniref:hypothetical protein n=1 Tax=Actinocrispum sp. NPDC049592 TaxID=3154835 RepID=UPI003441DFB0
MALVSDTMTWPSLMRYAALIEDFAGLRTWTTTVEDGSETDLRGLPSDVGAVFLQRTPPGLTCRARALTRGLPVLTDQDIIAIALTAALLTATSQAGRTPRTSTVVIAGADALPVLCPLLMIAGFAEVTTWNPIDADIFPLRRITSGAHTIVDLLHGTIDLTAAEVIRLDSGQEAVLVLPGLLRALTHGRGARLDLHVHHACALALVMATPPDRQLPSRLDQDLTDQVTHAAAHALHAQTHHPFD